MKEQEKHWTDKKKVFLQTYSNVLEINIRWTGRRKPFHYPIHNRYY